MFCSLWIFFDDSFSMILLWQVFCDKSSSATFFWQFFYDDSFLISLFWRFDNCLSMVFFQQFFQHLFFNKSSLLSQYFDIKRGTSAWKKNLKYWKLHNLNYFILFGHISLSYLDALLKGCETNSHLTVPRAYSIHYIWVHIAILKFL